MNICSVCQKKIGLLSNNTCLGVQFDLKTCAECNKQFEILKSTLNVDEHEKALEYFHPYIENPNAKKDVVEEILKYQFFDDNEYRKKEVEKVSRKSFKEYIKEKEARENLGDDFISHIATATDVDVFWTSKELNYLKQILNENEEVLSAVDGLLDLNKTMISGNVREIASQPSGRMRTWLMVLTNKRIILINRHLIVGTEYTQIPLDSVNAVSFQSRWQFSSISIMHGSGGIFIDYIKKGKEKKFVDKANEAIENIKNNGVNAIVNAFNMSNNDVTSFSNADEIKKYKELLDMGAITKEEYELKKRQLLGL